MESQSRQDRSRYLNVSIEDLHGHGPALASKLLTELANTGGQSSSDDGRTVRQLSADDDTITVQECFTPFQQCRLEVLVAQRFHVRAEAGHIDPEELRRYVQRIDLAALAARAKTNQPVE
jgi:hypothetical protein